MRRGRDEQKLVVEQPGTASHPLDAPLAPEARTERATSAEEHAVLARFAPKFGEWWIDGADEHVDQMERGLQRGAEVHDLDRQLGRLSHFYSLGKEDPPALDIRLIGTPAEFSRATHGQIRGADVYLETLIGEPASERLGVLAHEIAHYYYSLSPADLRLNTRQWFLDSDSAWAIPAYNLFNEALAAAFGHGLIDASALSDDRYLDLLALPESFYADVYIDRAAKAALPLLRAYLDDERVLDRAFVTAYIAAIGGSMDRRMSDLGFWLRSLVFSATSERLSRLAATIPQHFRTGAFMTERLDFGCQETCLLNAYPELSGIVAARSDDLGRLKAFLDEADIARVRRQTVVRGQAVFGFKRSDRSLLFVVSGSTDEEVDAALQRLLSFGSIFTNALPDS